MGSSEMTGSLVLALFASVLGMFQFGMNTGVINSPQSLIEEFIERSEGVEDGSFLFSLVVSFFLIGGMIGGLSGGFAGNFVGRRNALIFTQVFSMLGAALMFFCRTFNSTYMLLGGRFCVGLACGLFTGLVPLYVAEVAPVSIRGALGTLNQLAVTSGIFLSQIVSLQNVFGTQDTWHLLLALATAIPSLLQLVLLPMVPESPRFLILNRGDDAAGEAALKTLRAPNADIYAEVQQIASEAANMTTDLNVLHLLISSKWRLQLFVTVLMHLSQQLSGVVAVFYYSTSFFVGAGIAQDSAQYATIGVGLIMVVMTLITIPLMDRAGRRTLHLLGLLGIVICSALITVALLVRGSGGTLLNLFLVLSTLGFVVFFALGPGSIPWLITGELFTQKPRAAAASVATLVNWTANLAVGLCFPIMQNSLQAFSFLPFLIFTAIAMAILFRLLPETKGREVEEIEESMQQPNAWSGSYVRHGNYRDIEN